MCVSSSSSLSVAKLFNVYHILNRKVATLSPLHAPYAGTSRGLLDLRYLPVTLAVLTAEFYPSCTKFAFDGTQTGTFSQSISFPGAYNDNDPGSTIRAPTYRALHFSWSTHVESPIACDPGKSSLEGYH